MGASGNPNWWRSQAPTRIRWRPPAAGLDCWRPGLTAGGAASFLVRTSSLIDQLRGMSSQSARRQDTTTTLTSPSSEPALVFLGVVAGLVTVYVHGYLPRLERREAAELAARRAARAAARGGPRRAAVRRGLTARRSGRFRACGRRRHAPTPYPPRRDRMGPAATRARRRRRAALARGRRRT